MNVTDVILIAALGFAGWIAYKLHQRGQLFPAGANIPPPGAPGAPPGSFAIPLGQFAVRPEAQWLLVPPQGI
jgi:hypothetical protein